MIADGFYIVLMDLLKILLKKQILEKNLLNSIKKMIILVPGSSYLGSRRTGTIVALGRL